MSNRSLVILVTCLCGLFASGGACPGQECDEQVWVDFADTEGGEIHWIHNGEPGQSLLDDMYTPGLVCDARAFFGSFTGYGVSYGGRVYPAQTALSTHLNLFCYTDSLALGVDASERFTVLVAMGDLRLWGTGPVDASALAYPALTEPAVELWSYENCDGSFDHNDCTWCFADAPEAVVTAEVLEAAGGAADYPAVLTDDFLRVVRFEVSTGASLVGDGCLHTRSATAIVTVAFDPTQLAHEDCGEYSPSTTP